MKIICFGDLHAHAFQQHSHRLANGRNSRLQDCINIVETIIFYCLHEKVDKVIFLGDLYHSRTKIDIDVYNATYLVFKKLAQVADLYILVGNHDQVTKVGDIHSIEPYRDIATVIDKRRVISLDDNQEIQAAFYPYTTDIPEMLKWMKELPNDLDLFFFHQGLREAKVGPYDIHVKAELSVKDLPLDKARYLVGGHYHKRQSFLKDGKVHYVGSPLQLSYGERNETKAFTLINTDPWMWSTIPTRAPQFFLFETVDQFLSAKEIDAHTDESDKLYSEAFIRVYCLPEEVKELKKEHPDVQFVGITPETQTLMRVDSTLVNNDKDLLNAYIENKDSDLDQEQLLTLGLTLLGEDNE